MTSFEELLYRIRIGSSGGRRGWRCPNEEQLSAYLEQNVSSRQREHLEKHIAACDVCRDELGFLVKLQSQEFDEPAPEEWLVRARGLVARESNAPRMRAWRWGAAATATACALLAVTLWMKSKPEISSALPPAPTMTAPQVLAQNEKKPLRPITPGGAVVRNHARTESVPQVVFPKPNSIVISDGIEFRWKEMKGALSYEARLLSSEGDVLWEERVEFLSAKLPSNVTLRPGETYFLWVRAYLPEGKVAQSKATRFTVADQN